MICNINYLNLLNFFYKFVKVLSNITLSTFSNLAKNLLIFLKRSMELSLKRKVKAYILTNILK